MTSMIKRLIREKLDSGAIKVTPEAGLAIERANRALIRSLAKVFIGMSRHDVAHAGRFLKPLYTLDGFALGGYLRKAIAVVIVMKDGCYQVHKIIDGAVVRSKSSLMGWCSEYSEIVGGNISHLFVALKSHVLLFHARIGGAIRKNFAWCFVQSRRLTAEEVAALSQR